MKKPWPEIPASKEPLMAIHPVGCLTVMIGTFALAMLAAWKIGMFDKREDPQPQPSQNK